MADSPSLAFLLEDLWGPIDDRPRNQRGQPVTTSPNTVHRAAGSSTRSTSPARPPTLPTSSCCSGGSSAPGSWNGLAPTRRASPPPCTASCTSAGSSAAEPRKTSGSSPDAASPARAGRPNPSPARRSASPTPRSTPGARHGSNRSTAASDASSSSVDPSTTTSILLQRQGKPAAALALHRHRARLLPLARRDLTRRLRYLELRPADARRPRRAAPRRLEPSSVGGGCRPDADSTRRRPARDRTDTTGSQR